MKFAAKFTCRFWWSFVFIACLIPCAAAAADGRVNVPAGWKQMADVTFTELPWGRFTQISIEYLPDIGDDPTVYLDPAKRNELIAEAMASGSAVDPDAVGFSILITVPGLEYGMTGHWSNVRIESGNGISVPHDEDKVGSATGPGKNTNYTGELIITEFTKNVLKGSYRAQLFTDRVSMEEIRARKRNYQGEVSGEMNFDLSPVNAPAVNLAEVPQDLSDADAELLKRIQAAGVPPEVQGQMLEMLRGMNPEMQKMILESRTDSY